MKVLFCDNHVLVAVKPAGLSTQEDFTPQVKAWVKKAFKKPGAVFLEPIHRLDKSASGIVLFARTSKALSRLQCEMRERRIHKKYVALVEGVLTSDSGFLEHKLVHGSHRAEVVDSPSAKVAQLEYRVKERRSHETLIEVALLTGRYHQIRAQMAFIGHPLRGDAKYGGKSWKGHGIALHHTEMRFTHPVTKEPLVFEASSQFVGH